MLVTIVNRKGRIEYVNRAVESATGFSSEELLAPRSGRWFPWYAEDRSLRGGARRPARRTRLSRDGELPAQGRHAVPARGTRRPDAGRQGAHSAIRLHVAGRDAPETGRGAPLPARPLRSADRSAPPAPLPGAAPGRAGAAGRRRARGARDGRRALQVHQRQLLAGSRGRDAAARRPRAARARRAARHRRPPGQRRVRRPLPQQRRRGTRRSPSAFSARSRERRTSPATTSPSR